MTKHLYGFMGRVVMAAVISSAAASSSAFANDSSSGCGLGWQVSSRQSLASSAIRSTTNAFLPNTISMTFGTSGCARHQLVKGDEQAVLFAVNHYDTLMIELAQGSGEYLQGFARTLGCSDADFGRFSAATQSRYEAISKGSAEGISLYRAVRTELLSDSELKGRCVPSTSA